MKKPEVPFNEARRLRALQQLDILDTVPEKRFDRITRLAQRFFNVPIALVTLIDSDRQWFKSSMGLDVNETPRDISFCGHTILEDETFVVTDAATDPRFSDNPLVTGSPRIRFYAGQPLKVQTGERIGTLCIIDNKPRAFGADDIATLKDLAGLVEQELGILHIATTDELTGIPNRRGFMPLAQHSMNLGERQNAASILVYFDLNNFKNINDTYGHGEGDHALILFANQLIKSFRQSDICGRIGGDEFVLLASNASKSRVEEAINRFTFELRARALAEEVRADIEFSYGIAEFDPLVHQSVDDLIHSADQAMYKNKQQQAGG